MAGMSRKNVMLVTVFTRRTLDGSGDDRDQNAETGKHNERDSEVD